MKLQSRVLLCAILFLAVAADAARGLGAMVGGWKPISNLSDPHVQEIGEFAVTEHNKEAKSGLKLKSILKGETQVVSGINYKLVLAVNDGSAANKYEAVVWEKSWLNYKNLTSFKPVN